MALTLRRSRYREGSNLSDRFAIWFSMVGLMFTALVLYNVGFFAVFGLPLIIGTVAVGVPLAALAGYVSCWMILRVVDSIGLHRLFVAVLLGAPTFIACVVGIEVTIRLLIGDWSDLTKSLFLKDPMFEVATLPCLVVASILGPILVWGD